MSKPVEQETRSRRPVQSLLFPVTAAALALALLLSNRWYSAVDDECAVIDAAAYPLIHTLRRYLSGLGQHEHPPLYDILLHFWLKATNGNQMLVRLPAIVFYVLGGLVLASIAGRLCGSGCRQWLWINFIFWPYGFHFGRVAAWYSFSFLVVALLTYSYFSVLESATPRNCALLFAFSTALIYTNYFGWAILGFLALDYIVRNRRNLKVEIGRVTIFCGLLLILFIPILRAFMHEIRSGVHANRSLSAMIFTGIYNLYSLLVSESVAPWFWRLGIPVAIAIAVLLVAPLIRCPQPLQSFFFYFVALLALMSLLGIVETKRTMIISSWLLLPIAATLGASKPRKYHLVLTACVMTIGAIGWYGILARNVYAAPHWVEPWQSIAAQAADVVSHGGAVIANNPSFFFYATYLLPEHNGQDRFVGLLPDTASRSGVFDPQHWIASEYPVRPTMMLIKGLHYSIPAVYTENAESELAHICVLTRSEKLVYDFGATWKQRFAPETGQVPWRIEVQTYTCP